ncbi:hypothetical protein TNCV_2470301 [Trichonephila clavipes]|nr:hypothetical protein TNCV_2470301 [Trichonephila clavipes]
MVAVNIFSKLPHHTNRRSLSLDRVYYVSIQFLYLVSLQWPYGLQLMIRRPRIRHQTIRLPPPLDEKNGIRRKIYIHILTYTFGHSVKQSLEGIYRYRCPCSFDTISKLTNRSDWCMETVQSRAQRYTRRFLMERNLGIALTRVAAEHFPYQEMSVTFQKQAVVHYPSET